MCIKTLLEIMKSRKLEFVDAVNLIFFSIFLSIRNMLTLWVEYVSIFPLSLETEDCHHAGTLTTLTTLTPPVCMQR